MILENLADIKNVLRVSYEGCCNEIIIVFYCKNDIIIVFLADIRHCQMAVRYIDAFVVGYSTVV